MFQSIFHWNIFKPEHPAQGLAADNNKEKKHQVVIISGNWILNSILCSAGSYGVGVKNLNYITMNRFVISFMEKKRKNLSVKSMLFMDFFQFLILSIHSSWEMFHAWIERISLKKIIIKNFQLNTECRYGRNLHSEEIKEFPSFEQNCRNDLTLWQECWSQIDSCSFSKSKKNHQNDDETKKKYIFGIGGRCYSFHSIWFCANKVHNY